MQRALDAGPVIIAKAADAGDNILDVLFRHFPLVEDDFAIQKTGFRRSAQVQHDFNQLFEVFLSAQFLTGLRRQDFQ